MFSQSAAYYDRIYAFKDYAGETERLKAIIGDALRSGGNRLVDVACGTGRHLAHLRDAFQVEGLDLDERLLAVARQRLPGVPLHVGDMTAFALGRAFDVVTCLFSAIGYARTLDGLHEAVACMADHVVPGGLLIVEPWFTPAEWQPNTAHGMYIDEPELKIARLNTSYQEGRVSWFDLHYLVSTPEGTVHVQERHELGLFSREEMTASFQRVGLDVRYDAEGLMGRGLYVAHKSLT